MKDETLSAQITEKAIAVSGKPAEAIFSEMADIYLAGYADGYISAIERPAVKSGSTADQKEFEEKKALKRRL